MLGSPLRNTFYGLLSKSSLFVVAAIAVYALATLDRTKANFDYPKTALNSAFTINNGFRESVKVPLVKSWLEGPFNGQQFSNQRALLDALAAHALRRDSEERDPLVSEQISLARDLARLRTLQSQRKEDYSADIIRIESSIFDNAARIHKLDADLRQAQYDIYVQFGNNVPTLLRSQAPPAGFWDNLLNPFLDERRSLYVVYQVLRATALVILVLTIVFILVMASQRLPLPNVGETLSERLRTIVPSASAGATGEVAKTAIMSLAVVGIGTAVIIGGGGFDFGQGSMSQRLVSSLPSQGQWSTSENGSPASQNAVSLYLYRLSQSRIESYQTQFALSADLLFRPKVDFNPSLDFNPNLDFTPRLVFPQTVSVELKQLDEILRKLGPSPPLDELRKKIEALELRLANIKPGECKCDEFLRQISENLKNLNNVIGGASATPTPTITPGVTTSATPSPSPTPDASPTPPPNTILSNLTMVSGRLDEIQRQLSTIGNDARVNQLGDKRNLYTRIGRLFTREHYLVTEQAYQSLSGMLSVDPDNSRIIAALQKMKGKPPMKKSDFIKALREGADRQTLKPWEKMILIYSRLPR